MEPILAYYSSTSENTRRFVEKLPFEAYRIPMASAETLTLHRPHVLVMPTYGGGQHKVKGAVPKQVGQFLNDPANRANCLGIIGNGNTSFGDTFILGPMMVAKKIGVPVLYAFEVFGTQDDVVKVTAGLRQEWQALIQARGLAPTLL